MGDSPKTADNYACVSYMLDHEIWEDKFSRQFQSGAVEYIIGCPTVEQFIEAYNDFHQDTGEQYDYVVEKSTSYGYTFKSSTESKYGYSVTLSCGFEDDCSILFLTDTSRTLGLWLSSPGDGYGCCAVTYQGVLGEFNVTASYTVYFRLSPTSLSKIYCKIIRKQQ